MANAKPPPRPVLPTDAPRWAQDYANDMDAYMSALLRELAALKKRLADAGIP